MRREAGAGSSTADRRGQPPSPPLTSKGPLQCLDLTFLGPASQAWSTAPLGQGAGTAHCSPASLSTRASLPRVSSSPSSGYCPHGRPLPHLSVFSLSHCFAAVLSHSSLPCSACLFLPFSAAGSVSRVSMFAFCHLFHQKQKLPESKDWKMATLSNVFHSRRPAPAASLILGRGWTPPRGPWAVEAGPG